jgi:hypothetical protein
MGATWRRFVQPHDYRPSVSAVAPTNHPIGLNPIRDCGIALRRQADQRGGRNLQRSAIAAVGCRFLRHVHLSEVLGQDTSIATIGAVACLDEAYLLREGHCPVGGIERDVAAIAPRTAGV